MRATSLSWVPALTALLTLTTAWPLNAQEPAGAGEEEPTGAPAFAGDGGGSLAAPQALGEGLVGNGSVDPSVLLPRRVTVIGLVARPGTFDLRPRMTTADALRLAGGLRAEAAMVALIRFRPTAPAGGAAQASLTLEAALRPPQQLATRELGPMDLVVALPAREQGESGITVVGEVLRPGTVPVPQKESDPAVGQSGAEGPATSTRESEWRVFPGQRLSLGEALAAAGGLTASAMRERIVLVPGESGQAAEFLDLGQPAERVLPRGSIVIVPARGQVPANQRAVLQPLDLDLQGVTLEEAFRRISAATGGEVPIELDPKVSRDARAIKVEATLRGVPVLNAVTDLARQANLQAQQNAAGIRIAPRNSIRVLPLPDGLGPGARGQGAPAARGPSSGIGRLTAPTFGSPGSAAAPGPPPPVPDLGAVGRRPVVLQYQGTPLRDALAQVLTTAQVSYIFEAQEHPTWRQPLTMNARGLPLQTALNAISRSSGLIFQRSGDMLRISPWPLPENAAAPTAGKPAYHVLLRRVAVEGQASPMLSKLVVPERGANANAFSAAFLQRYLAQGSTLKASTAHGAVLMEGEPGLVQVLDSVAVKLLGITPRPRGVRVAYEVSLVPNLPGQPIPRPLRGVLDTELGVARPLPSPVPGVYVFLTLFNPSEGFPTGR